MRYEANLIHTKQTLRRVTSAMSLANERTASLRQGPRHFSSRDRANELVKVPIRRRLARRFDLEKVVIAYHSPVDPEFALVGHRIFDGELAHLGHDRIRIACAGRLNGLKIVIDSAVHERLTPGQGTPHPLRELGRPRPRLIVQVPVERRGHQQALRRLQTERHQRALQNDERCGLLAGLYKSELGETLQATGLNCLNEGTPHAWERCT